MWEIKYGSKSSIYVPVWGAKTISSPLAFAEGLGLFGDEEQPNLTANQFVYDPSQNVLPNMQQQFFNQASDFDVIPNVPGGIEEYLQSIGLLAKRLTRRAVTTHIVL